LSLPTESSRAQSPLAESREENIKIQLSDLRHSWEQQSRSDKSKLKKLLMSADLWADDVAMAQNARSNLVSGPLRTEILYADLVLRQVPRLRSRTLVATSPASTDPATDELLSISHTLSYYAQLPQQVRSYLAQLESQTGQWLGATPVTCLGWLKLFIHILNGLFSSISRDINDSSRFSWGEVVSVILSITPRTGVQSFSSGSAIYTILRTWHILPSIPSQRGGIKKQTRLTDFFKPLVDPASTTNRFRTSDQELSAIAEEFKSTEYAAAVSKYYESNTRDDVEMESTNPILQQVTARITMSNIPSGERESLISRILATVNDAEFALEPEGEWE
jgi:hypothetical protein